MLDTGDTLVSVFTPSHNPRFLDDAYRSLAAQTYPVWEWVVLLNGAAREWRPPTPDDRVRVVRERVPKRVGAAKRAACAHATGAILVELDHDDLLASRCLAEVVAAFDARPEIVAVYTDFAQLTEDGSSDDTRFNPDMGWEYSSEDVDGATRLRCHGMKPTPHNMSLIWYEPNHVRAFRRNSYDEVGGYNPELTVLDDQDLLVRLYKLGEFHHIEECLYLQRMHRANTQVDPAINAHIQNATVGFYYDHIDGLAEAWAERQRLQVVTVTAASVPKLEDHPGARVIEIDPVTPVLPFDDNSVAVIRAHELLQRIPDRAAFFNECYRVLAHAGFVMTMTPSTDGRGAFQDPSHVAFYNENSFWYLTEERFRPSIPTLRARFQLSQMRTFFPNEWAREHAIAYVQANLLAIKDGPRQGGSLLV